MTTRVASESWLEQRDARARLWCVVLMAMGASMAGSGVALLCIACGAVGLWCAARTDARLLLRRLFVLNIFLALLAGGTLLSGERDPLTRLAIASVKANIIATALTALLHGMDPMTLSRALEAGGCPHKLVQLIALAARYVDVLAREQARMRTALRARGFRPRFDRHTLRTLGYVAGMLLVRAFDRADRVARAMRCRGFNGRFALAGLGRLGKGDLGLLGASAALALFACADRFR